MVSVVSIAVASIALAMAAFRTVDGAVVGPAIALLVVAATVTVMAPLLAFAAARRLDAADLREGRLRSPTSRIVRLATRGLLVWSLTVGVVLVVAAILVTFPLLVAD